MTRAKLTIIVLLFFVFIGATIQESKFDFRIRTITAGITLRNISDAESITKAIQFLNKSEQAFIDKGYEVQTVRISTQNLYELIGGKPTRQTIDALKKLDEVATKNNVIISIGELIAGNQYDPELVDWTIQLTKETSSISFSIPISSENNGIHDKSIKVAAKICRALSLNSKGGEANFRFTASANCPSGIPFFPAAYHIGKNSFAIGLEYPNVITRVFKESSWENAEANLKAALEKEMRPIEIVANQIQKTSGWIYDGIDTSPAPGLDASIGEAIETLTKKPFGSSTTLSACAIITKVIKNLGVNSCGYSGLMLPVVEDKVLAKRASEGTYSVQELLLYSSVSGTGLDVVPIAGNTSIEEIEGVYRDVAALSIKYFNKPLSARLFPIPGKGNGDTVEFENPSLTSSVVMKLD